MGSKRSETDGVRVVRGRGVRREVWLVAFVAIAIALAAVFWMRPRPDDARGKMTDVAVSRPRPPAAAPAPAGAVGAPVRMERLPEPAREVPAGSRVADDSTPAMEGDNAEPAAEAEPGTAIGDEGGGDAPTGIALFPPPGTDPIRPGIIVPDDFPLPPGYVRHYQVTDDGKQLPAILMFHPDYAPVDANGEPLAVPADRIVPPDMAPPGLAIEMLQVPEEQVPMIEFPEGRAEDTAP